MSLICVKDLENIVNKTLLYFTHSIPLSSIPNSFVYFIPGSLSQFISDIRRFNLESFPIICYDSGDMKLSSQAYFIMKAIGYEVFVIYGGINACEEEGIPLSKELPREIQLNSFEVEIDVNCLPNFEMNCVLISELPFLLYDVFGSEISQEKIKKLLDSHNIKHEYQDVVLSGEGASVLGVILIYLEKENISVFLGHWQETLKKRKDSEKPEVFFTVAESVYYDAIEELPNEIEETEKSESVIIEHYNVPLIEPTRKSCSYQIERHSNLQCKGCNLL